jgi:hypothetical protein
VEDRRVDGHEAGIGLEQLIIRGLNTGACNGLTVTIAGGPVTLSSRLGGRVGTNRGNVCVDLSAHDKHGFHRHTVARLVDRSNVMIVFLATTL